jgi:hypothetical protein
LKFSFATPVNNRQIQATSSVAALVIPHIGEYRSASGHDAAQRVFAANFHASLLPDMNRCQHISDMGNSSSQKWCSSLANATVLMTKK